MQGKGNRVKSLLVVAATKEAPGDSDKFLFLMCFNHNDISQPIKMAEVKTIDAKINYTPI